VFDAPKKIMISAAKFATPGRPTAANTPNPRRVLRRHDPGKTAKFVESQCCLSLAQSPAIANNNAMESHEQISTPQRQSCRESGAKDPEEDVAHVHHARVTEHQSSRFCAIVKPALRK